MKIVLATGIYPPAIGGPATYVQKLAGQLSQRGIEVIVITYARSDTPLVRGEWPIVTVSKSGGPLLRWNRYARALQQHAKDADIVICFSTMSCGIPLFVARLKKPKKVLRLGGDVLWERYTDLGGRLSLRAFYRSKPRTRRLMTWMLKIFDHIIFSTAFQAELYDRWYKGLPDSTIIENALPGSSPILHQKHDPLRILYLGRFVRFKNIPSLLRSVATLPHVRLTLAGEGPLLPRLIGIVEKRGLGARVTFLPPAMSEEKQRLFLEHDLLVLPSFTDISPHAAIEARAAGLPVLLTEETGLSPALTQGVMLQELRSPKDITRAILEIERNYEEIAKAAAEPLDRSRSWEDLTEEHLMLYRRLL